MGSQPSKITPPAAPSESLGAKRTASGQEDSKPKPCCVCKEEKSIRDECMLMSKAPNPEEDCKSTILAYKKCMEGFGFQI